MSDTNTLSIAVELARGGTIDTLEQLTALAVMPRWKDRRFGLSSYGKDYHLTATGGSRFSRHTPHFVLAGGLAEVVAGSWKKNIYRTPVGSKTLARVVKDAGGINVLPALRAAQREEDAAAAKKRAANQLHRWTELAVEMLDLAARAEGGLGTSAVGEARHSVPSAMYALERALNDVTRTNAFLASVAAYDALCNPRKA